MRSRSIAIVALLGLILVVAIGVRGAASFDAVRWLPDWGTGRSAPKPPQSSVAPPHSAAPIPVAKPGETVDVPVLLLILLAVLVAVAVLLIVRWLTRRRRRPAPEEIDAVLTGPPVATEGPEPDAPVLRRGFELALHVLGTEPEPRDAIVKAWLGLQDAAAESGIDRGAAETPTEFTSRILGRVDADEQAITTLLRLYLGVRFGHYAVGEDDIARARASLESLASSWSRDRASEPRSEDIAR